MVCDRCIMVVAQILESLQYKAGMIKLGEVEILEEPANIDMNAVSNALKKVGFELIENKKQVLAELIKTLVIEEIYQSANTFKMNFSDYLSEKTGHDYHYISHIFSESENTTIEKYIISIKIKRIKELLQYGELSISEIAWKMGYSSVQALSTQFKKVALQTPGEYKKSLVND